MSSPHDATNPPLFRYPATEWSEALSHLQAAMKEPGEWEGRAPLESMLFFAGRYADPEEREWKKLRFEKAMRWLDAHIGEFDFGSAGVVGKDEALLQPAVYEALHLVFAEIDTPLLFEDPPPGFVLDTVLRILKRGT